MQKLCFLYLVQRSLSDTNSRRLINVALFSCFRGGKDLFPTVKLTCHFWHFFSFFKMLRLVFFYGLELRLVLGLGIGLGLE